MASKYIQKFPVPEGFPEILHDLAKEILRNQPADILEFSALYFKCLQEGTVLDYPNRGQNIPCDFKTGVPKISERPQRKKPLNERDEALHNAAVENSSNIAKKPMSPDRKLMEADAAIAAKNNNTNNTAENLINDLKEKSNGNERKNTEKSIGSAGRNKTEENVGKRDNMSSAKASRKSENRPESRNSPNNTKEIAEVSEKFLEDVLTKKTQEVNERGLMDEHINSNKENSGNNEQNNNEQIGRKSTEDSPKQVEEIQKNDEEPKQDNEPKQEEESPKQEEESPKQEEESPKQEEESPQQAEESPKQAEETPQQEHIVQESTVPVPKPEFEEERPRPGDPHEVPEN